MDAEVMSAQLTSFDLSCPTCKAVAGQQCHGCKPNTVHSKRRDLRLKMQSEGYTKDSPPPAPPPIDYTKRIYYLLVGVLIANVVGYVVLAMQVAGATP